MSKITALPVVDEIDGTELLPIVQRGDTKRVTMTALRALIVPFLQNWYKGDRGETGPAFATYTGLRPFKAAPTSNRVQVLQDPDLPAGIFNWVTGEAPYFEDGFATIAADDAPTTEGIWERLNAAALVFRQTGEGTIPRALDRKLCERPATPQDFGAKGDAYIGATADDQTDRGVYGGTDDTLALQRWYAAGCAGRPLHLPRGSYLLKGPLYGKIADIEHRLSITGDGAGCTEILYAGDRNVDAITVIGNMPNYDQLLVRGFRVTTPDISPLLTGSGAGLRIENVRNFVVGDYRSFRVGKSLHLIGCLVGRVHDLFSYYDRKGIVCEQGPYLSTPNALSFEQVTIGASYEVGIELSQPTLVRITNASTIEGVGIENPTGGIGISIGGSGQAGAIGLWADGVYFEQNKGYDIYISHVDTPAVHRVTGCTFNRLVTGSSHACIVFDASAVGLGGAPAMLDVRGSGFIGYGEYQASEDTPYISIVNPHGWPGLTFLDDGVIYANAVERPAVPAEITHPRTITIHGFARYNGELSRSGGMRRLERVSPGIFRIYPARGTQNILLMISIYAGGKIHSVTAETPEYREYTFTDLAGTPVDTNFEFQGFYV